MGYTLTSKLERRFNYEEVKEWFKKHKKEIIVGAAAIGGAAFYFLIKNKSSVRANLSFNIHFDSNDGLSTCYDRYNKDYYNFTLNSLNLGLADLGRLGEMIAEKLPIVKTDNAHISSITGTYSTCNKQD